ncbi:MAG: transketolase [Spirochaetae bacterium HGW-Spirochaetae-9]|nr:MAG: transketolase [Spirochaetae bacterium HGW-Spirochaetae-9]
MAAKEMRAAYTETLLELAKEDPRIVVVEADLMKATGTTPFKTAFPERAFDVGVAEANMLGVAAGLAAEGKIPFAATFGCFASRRAFDQFFMSGAYARLPVKLVGTDPGISAAFNGGTHMPFEDLGIMRMVPGIDIIEPSDPVSLKALVRKLAASGKVGYLRLHRKAIEALYPEGEAFELGKGKLLREGKDVVIVALGAIMVPEALAAAKILEAEGIEAAVIDAISVKPLDAGLIGEWIGKTGAVVTAENHQKMGGLGSAVAELIAESELQGCRLARVGVADEFGEVGTQDWLKTRFGLSAEDIAAAARSLVAGKGKRKQV